MPQSQLPDPSTLAVLVSNVTKTMCGLSFVPAAADERTEQLCWRIATLPIGGARPIRVALSSDEAGCAALGSALFSMPPEQLDQSMIDDSLCELLNMAAGQIKTALALDQALGLPKIVSAKDLPAGRALVEGVVLRSCGSIGLLIWVSEGAN
jgi:hypothetical protein